MICSALRNSEQLWSRLSSCRNEKLPRLYFWRMGTNRARLKPISRPALAVLSHSKRKRPLSGPSKLSVCRFPHLRFLFTSCAISRWCRKVGRVLPAQSFNFGSSPPFA
jgi:hypothetical protein